MTSAFAQHKLVQKPSKQHRFDCLASKLHSPQWRTETGLIPVFIVSVIVLSNFHSLQFLNKMFNVFTLLLVYLTGNGALFYEINTKSHVDYQYYALNSTFLISST